VLSVCGLDCRYTDRLHEQMTLSIPETAGFLEILLF